MYVYGIFIFWAIWSAFWLSIGIWDIHHSVGNKDYNMVLDELADLFDYGPFDTEHAGMLFLIGGLLGTVWPLGVALMVLPVYYAGRLIYVSRKTNVD